MEDRQCSLAGRVVQQSVSCKQCMYDGADGTCLNTVVDTTEFARRKGIKPADVERVRVRAELSIMQGLCLYEYMQWFRAKITVGIKTGPSSVLVKDRCTARIKESEVLSAMNILPQELACMASKHMWNRFCKDTGVQQDVRVDQVMQVTADFLDYLSDKRSHYVTSSK